MKSDGIVMEPYENHVEIYLNLMNLLMNTCVQVCYGMSYIILIDKHSDKHIVNVIQTVLTGSTTTLGYMWLHCNTSSLSHNTSWTYIAIADLAACWHHLICVSLDAIIFLVGVGGSTDMCRCMQSLITCWLIISMTWLGGNVVDCILFPFVPTMHTATVQGAIKSKYSCWPADIQVDRACC